MRQTSPKRGAALPAAPSDMLGSILRWDNWAAVVGAAWIDAGWERQRDHLGRKLARVAQAVSKAEQVIGDLSSEFEPEPPSLDDTDFESEFDMLCRIRWELHELDTWARDRLKPPFEPPRRSGKQRKPEGARQRPAFSRFVSRLYTVLVREGHKVTLWEDKGKAWDDKDKLRGTLVDILTELTPLLPPGFVPNGLSEASLRRWCKPRQKLASTPNK